MFFVTLYKSTVSENKLNTFFKKYSVLISAIIAVLGVYIIMNAVGITCPIKYITGISCAGCGMTRAWLCFLRFDFATALSYHPLFLLVPPAVVFLFLRKRHPRVSKIALIIIAVIFIIVYIIRMLDDGCNIVVFEPKNSLIYRIIHRVI